VDGKLSRQSRKAFFLIVAPHCFLNMMKSVMCALCIKLRRASKSTEQRSSEQNDLIRKCIDFKSIACVRVSLEIVPLKSLARRFSRVLVAHDALDYVAPNSIKRLLYAS
jgi:hypothetical protein